MTLQWVTRGNLRGPQGPPGDAATSDGGGYRSGFVPADQGVQPVIRHDLGSADLVVTVQDVTGRLLTEVPVETVDATGAASDNHIRLTFLTAPTASQYRYTILSAAPAPTLAQHTHDDYAPAVHAAQHAAGGTDPVTPAAIGASPSTHTHDLSGYVPTTRQVTAGSGLTGGGTLAADRSLAVSFASATPAAVAATGAVGTGTTAARADHTHAGVPTARTVSAGTGLTGGGDLSANRTLAVSYGSAAGTAVQGNDARVTADQVPGTASIRTLGTGAQQAAPGDALAQLRTVLYGAADRTRPPACVLYANADRTIPNADVWQDTQWAVSQDTDGIWAPGLVGSGAGYMQIPVAGRYRVRFFALVGGIGLIFYASKITLNNSAGVNPAIASDVVYATNGNGEPFYLAAENVDQTYAVGDKLRFSLWRGAAAGTATCYASWFTGIRTVASLHWLGPA